jgi:biopolymer transport protein ExbD
MRIQQKKEEPEIPTASMADIAFLLIVFFMLTTVFSANKGMEHILPPQDENTDAIEPEDSIYIRIYPSGNFEIDKQSFSIDQAEKVYNYVNEKVQVNAKKPIIVHTNPQAPYGDMVIVLNQLKQLEHDLDVSLAITIPSRAEAQRYEASGM